MKLLLISVKSNISKGGIATWTDRFLASCEAHGIACTLVNTEAVGKRREQGTARRNLFDEVTRTCRIFRDLGSSLGADYDAAHLNTSCGTFGLFRDFMLARRIKKKGLRLITHFHCDIPHWIHNSISRRYLGKLVALSDEKLVLCENSRQYLEDAFGVSSKKVPNFLDDNMIRTDDKPISDTLSTAFFVGRVEEAKGARELYALAARFPQMTFRLAGAVSDTVATWERPDNVVFAGSLPHAEVLGEMDRADIFVFPSHSEGFSLALTEAMARGLPSVATDVGANADMLADGCGSVVPVGDVDAMANAIEGLSDADTRKEISRRAVRKVREQYATDVIVDEIKRYYL
jgi:glycosyltransferase involved in cell wall biosynthesis